MLPLDKKMQVFQTLSYRDMWRVRGFLAQGKAPDNPRMAAAVVELAESLQNQSRIPVVLIRWAPAAAVVGFGVGSILAGAGGDGLQAILYGVIALLNVVHLVFNPAIRPKKMARSLEASRRVVAMGS